MQIIFIIVEIQEHEYCQEKFRDKNGKEFWTKFSYSQSLVDSFSKIGKNTRSKDRNAARHVLSQSIVNKNTKLLGFLKPTCKIVNLNIKTLRRYSIRREHLDTTNQTDFWAFIGRLPRCDMKLVDVVKGLVEVCTKTENGFKGS